MTEYVAIVVVVLGIMIYLIHLAFSLSENYDPLKLLLIGVSMIFGVLLFHIGKLITLDQSASAALQNAMDIGFYVWVSITSIALIYIAVFLIIRAYNALFGKKKIKLYDDETV